MRELASGYVPDTPLGKSLAKTEAGIRTLLHEKALVFNPDGTIFLERNGTSSQVLFTAQEFKTFTGKVFTHNHPGNTSFSDSQKGVDGLEKTDKLVHFFDENITGFGVDVKLNNKSYFVRGRVNGRLITYTFAKCNVLLFDDAKKKAKALLVKIDAGIHPAEEEKQKVLAAEADKKKNFTLNQILGEYLENNKLKDSTKENYRSNIQVYLKDWLNTPMRLITEQDIKARHKLLSIKVELPKKSAGKLPDKKVKPKRIRRNGPGIADGVMKTLRALFTYAIEEHKIIAANPYQRREEGTG